MERSEASLVPEWLKGASGSTLASPHPAFYQEDGGNTYVPRPRATQQAAGAHTDYDSPRGSASERSSFSSGRRSHGSTSVDRTNLDRDNHSLGRLHSSLTRSSSFKQGYVPLNREKEREGNRSEVTRERDLEQDGERSFWSREVEGLSGISSEERKKERDRLENGRLRLIIPGKPGSYDSDAKLRRPQSMGLSPRMSDSNAWKGTEGGAMVSLPMPSVSVGLATSIQKAAFERNFPSLGIDDKPVGLVASSVSSPTASPRPPWQSPLRSDLGRASSPGLVGGMGGPQLSMNGGSDLWNSVLAEVPSSLDSMQNISLGISALPCSSSSLSYVASSMLTAATTATALNMAEALSQPPQRVRTPPQSAAESQRLEELALKQSRQLIPMTPSLPKTMSLSDKGKSKSIRTVDASRSSSSSRPEIVKHSQGKLLVLKANKDGGVLATTALKSEGTQSSPHGSLNTGALPFLGTGASAQHRKSHDYRGSQPSNGGIDTLAGVRTKDPIEDKRPSIQAQNRSDFFNTLRKKAANNGNSFITPKSDSRRIDSVGVLSEAAVLEEAGTSNHVSSTNLGGIGGDCTSYLHSNGGTDYLQRKGLITEEVVRIDCDGSAMKCGETIVSVDSEEEEAAFMRSLGWEENAEDSELTEEEINAFYQMRERRKLPSNEGCRDVRMEPSVNSAGICRSSSESESDDESHA